MTDEAQSEEQPREPKIDLTIGILITLVMVTFDFAEIIPFVGDITSLLAFFVNFYLASMGINGLIFLTGNLIDFIPLLQALPWKTTGWIITWALDHFAPAAAAALEEIGKTAQAAKGGGAKGVEGKPATGGAAAEGAAEKAPSGAPAAGTAETAEGRGGATPSGGEEVGVSGERPATTEQPAQRGGGVEAGEEGQPSETGTAAKKGGPEPEEFGEQREELGKEGQEGKLEREYFKEAPKPKEEEDGEDEPEDLAEAA